MTNKKLFKIVIYLILLFVIIYYFVSFNSKNGQRFERFNQTNTKDGDYEPEEKEESLHLIIAKHDSSFKNCLNTSEGHSSYLRWHKRVRPKYCTNDVTDVFLIRSSIFRNSLRLVLRSTWAQDVNVKGSDNERIISKRIFIIGSPKANFTSPLITVESNTYNDILQGFFEDSITANTYKILLGMKFVKLHCPNVKRIYVTDDDSIVFPWNLYFAMKELQQEDGRFGGFVHEFNKPVRDKSSVSYVSEKDYACAYYPPYPSSALYFFSYDTMIIMYSLAQKYRILYLDDVFFGTIAELGNIPITKLGPLTVDCSFLLRPHSTSHQENTIACHDAIFANDQTTIWTEVCHKVVGSESIKRVNNAYCLKTLTLNKI